MRKINLDYTAPTYPKPETPQYCIGLGRASEMLRTCVDKQLALAKKDCGFRYIRFHGLLTDDMRVYDEDVNGNPVYNFMYVDQCFDAILEKGVLPFVELGFMPDKLKGGEQTVFWWRANVSLPASFEKWAALIEAVVRHFVERYGIELVRTWPFEVWNEPNWPAFFTAGMKEYFQLYDATVAAVKRVDESLMVGGPATCMNAWVPDMIAHCVENGLPLDFITTHHYGVDGALDEFGREDHVLLPNPNEISDNVLKVRKQIEESPMPGLPLYYTEWSSSYSSRDCVHDSFFEAGYILNTLKRVGTTAQGMSYWTLTDIFEEAGPPPSPFHGGFGLLTTQGFKKPAYFAYELLNSLPERLIDTGDEQSYAGVYDDGIKLLAWDYRNPNQDAPNNTYFTRALEPEAVDEIRVALAGLPEGRYNVKLARVGAGSNDVYHEYFNMGRPQVLSKAQEEKLLSCNELTYERDEALTVDSGAEIIIPMRAHDVVFLTLTRQA